MAKKCEDCKFWNLWPADQQGQIGVGVSIGECLRYPPMITGNMRVVAGHPSGGAADFYTGPITRDGDWCGEFKT